MKKMIVLIGIPGSGKSTFANKLAKEEGFIRVNRDDIRMSCFGTEHNPAIEGSVTAIEQNIIKTALKSGKSVVIDNCNVKQSYRNEFMKIAESIGDVEYEEIIVKTSPEECMKRNEKRDRKVPIEVIAKFAKEGKNTIWGNYKPVKVTFSKKEANYLVQNDALPRAVVCDNDGTLSLLNGRNPYDASTCDQDLPHIHVVEMIKLMFKNGYKILFVSGREEKYRDQTIKFYEKYLPGVEYELYMRPTGNSEKDVIIKQRIYDQHIKEKYYISAWFDDRLQICKWLYEAGFPLFRVNDPEASF